MQIEVKICGISESTGLDAALESDATYVGFVFFPPSPRSVTTEIASELAKASEGRTKRVGLMVNPTDFEISEIITKVPLDIIQL
ncbi:MAG: N-(5'-phosphoribosyl)anthranilate isomerase, partial [Rhodospirillales bacterium]